MGDGPRQPVQLGHDESVALSGEVDGGIQFRPHGNAGYLLPEDAFTAGLLKLGNLGVEARLLLHRRCPGRANKHDPLS
jgi:hypothetical protein